MRKVTNYVMVSNSVVKDIKKQISEWEDFANSSFCDTKERKESAHGIINRLKRMLNAAESDVLEQEDFTWFMCIVK